jgi:hypothetical protein
MKLCNCCGLCEEHCLCFEGSCRDTRSFVECDEVCLHCGNEVTNNTFQTIDYSVNSKKNISKQEQV